MKYKTLYENMSRKRITIRQVAILLRQHRNSIYNKMRGNGNSDFTIQEAITVRKAFFPEKDIEELFTADNCSPVASEEQLNPTISHE